MKLSEQECDLLQQYSELNKSKPNLFLRLAVEVVPPALFIGLGLLRGEYIWFIALVAILVTYNVLRVLKQYKNISILASIADKTVVDTHQVNSPELVNTDQNQ